MPSISGGGVADREGIGFDDFASGFAISRRQLGCEFGRGDERFEGGGDLAAVGVVQEGHLSKLGIDHAITDLLDNIGEGGRGVCRRLRFFKVAASGAGQLDLGGDQQVGQRRQLLDRFSDDRLARQQPLLHTDEAVERLCVPVGRRLLRRHAACGELIHDGRQLVARFAGC
jgi:hypothetical protein